MKRGLVEWLQAGQEDPSIAVAGRTLPLTIRRHPRARRMTMRLAPDGTQVRITLPPWGRTRDALVFAHARTQWLERQLADIPETAPPAPGADLLYRGDAIKIRWDSSHPRKPRLLGADLLLGGPEDTLPGRVKRWLEAEALRLMAEDLEYYCARAGLPYVPQLRLSRAQRRWGSCSGHGNDKRSIRINWRLIQAPDPVRRSVVAHEVAHLTHFDHSPAFHAHLADLFEGTAPTSAEGALKDADAWLKREGRSLYAPFG